MKRVPNILIVEDEPLIAEDISDLCQLNGYTVCGVAYRALEALELLKSIKPSLVLLDINLEDCMTGIDIAQRLKNQYAIPFIFLTSYADRKTLENAKSTNPMGYVVKPFNKEQLYSTIEIAWSKIDGNATNELDMAKVNAQLVEPLSRRETEVLSCLLKGMNNQAIAEALFISANTVKFHLKNLYLIFNVHNRVELLYKLKQMAG